jgi:hypothetical protein
MRYDPINFTSTREGIPRDSEWLDMDASETDAWYNIRSEKLMGVSRRFVFNVDETGCSEHIDSHEVTIGVPIEYPDPSVPVPVNRHTKRSILTAWSESSAPHHNIEAFLRIGLVPFEEPLRSGEYYLMVQREAARGARRWSKLEEGGNRAPLQPEGRRMARLPTG